jgi:DNA-binding CsgD family transcriptional regulator
LLERDAELDALADAVQRAAGGDGSLVLAEGPAGIGKTRLLLAAREQARAAGFAVLRARGAALERDVAHGVVRQLFERRLVGAQPGERTALLSGPAAAAASVVLGATGDAPPGADAAAPLTGPGVTRALYWLALALAADRPLLLLADDLHWADAPSLHALAYLAGRLDDTPILLLAASRDDEPGADRALLAELATAPEATVLRPAPLTRPAVGALTRTAFGEDAPDGFLDACGQATGGNPFLLTELLGALAADGRRPGTVDADEVAGAGPAAVARTILLRLGRLGEPARALARAAAILPDGAEPRHAATLADLDAQTARSAADTLVAAGLLEHGRLLRFPHALVRAAVADDVPPASRAAAHRRAAALLRAEGARDEAIVPHLLAAEPSADPEVVAVLRRTAATAMAGGAADSAVRHLLRALVEPPRPTDLPDVLADLGRAELRGGHFAAADEHLRRAADLAGDPVARARLGHDLAQAAFSVGGFEAAAAAIDRALAGLGDAEPSVALGLEADLALMAHLFGREHPVLERLDHHRDADPATRPGRTALAVLAQRELDRGRDAEATGALAVRALAGGRLVREDSTEALPWYFAVYALMTAESDVELDEALEDGFADARRRGSTWGFSGVSGVRALRAVQTGDLREAEAHARAGADTAVPSFAYSLWSWVALAQLEQGDVEAAAATLAEHPPPGSEPFIAFRWWAFLRARVLLSQGRGAEALAELEPLEAIAAGGREMMWPWRPVAALARVCAGQAEEGRAMAADAVARARVWGRPRRLGEALLTLAEVGADDARETCLREAVAVLAPSSARLEHARARHALGIALLRAGRRGEGREQLEQALDLARACGARALAESARDELLVAGAAPQRLSFDSLTAAERRVADLAAEGRTNREIAELLFVTPKTVENHLGRAYVKLGIASRRQLAVALVGA